jgi:hypothetical protein
VEDQAAVLRPDEDDVLLAVVRELGDGTLLAVAHRLGKEMVRALGALVRAEVVRVFEVDGIDTRQRHERPDLDRAVGLGLERVELLLGERDRAAVLALVALHDLGARDHLLVVRAVELLPDPRAAGRVDHVEMDLLRLGRDEDADRD